MTDRLMSCPFCGDEGEKGRQAVTQMHDGNRFDRIICRCCGAMCPDLNWNKRAATPDGHALVPKKVTNAMIDAANATDRGIAGSPPHWQWVWDAMLAAAEAPNGEKRDA